MSLNCKKCGGNSYHKSGIMNSKQRYRCKICGCVFTEGDARIKYNDNERFLAITLFRKGLYPQRQQLFFTVDTIL